MRFLLAHPALPAPILIDAINDFQAEMIATELTGRRPAPGELAEARPLLDVDTITINEARRLLKK